jgi:hypothetical protein
MANHAEGQKCKSGRNLRLTLRQIERNIHSVCSLSIFAFGRQQSFLPKALKTPQHKKFKKCHEKRKSNTFEELNRCDTP